MRRLARTAVVLGVFIVLNARNWCAPGWCAWYGLPVKFYGWSDEIVEINGHVLGQSGFSPFAFAFDLAVALSATYVAYFGLRKPSSGRAERVV